MNFREYANYGYTEIASPSAVRIFRDRYNWQTLCVLNSSRFSVISAVWQGHRLIVHTDYGPTFIFSDFNSYETIWGGR